jgi:hypothetical protein
MADDFTDVEVDMLLERFDQTEPALQRRIVAQLVADRERLTAERDKLAAFKAFVHARLDAAGVPPEFPDGPHTREGCRIGDRLDWLVERLKSGSALLFEALGHGDRMCAAISALEAENAALRAQVAGLAERVAAQSEILSREAERPQTQGET